MIMGHINSNYGLTSIVTFALYRMHYLGTIYTSETDRQTDETL